ncbi:MULTISPECIES: mechanosensitive ion channel domain-containing protein [Bradyrhizobium]|uniref:mechanosensitive ion channel domain-containing protein n=1 Tax=unclassified Bradyrhizobium TaxID=2631580 RepID=UPI003082AC29
MALQGPLSNIAAGVMLLLFRPFHIGNDVEVTCMAGKVKSLRAGVGRSHRQSQRDQAVRARSRECLTRGCVRDLTPAVSAAACASPRAGAVIVSRAGAGGLLRRHVSAWP